MEPNSPADRPALDLPAGGPPGPTSSAGPPRHRLWALAIVGSLLAGVSAWLAGEATLTHFMPPTRQVVVMGGAKMDVPSAEDQAVADRKNATLANGLLGAFLGLALGAAGALARGTFGAAVPAAVAGLIFGAAGGVCGSAAVLPVYYRQLARHGDALSRDLLLPLLVHAGAWAAVGAAGGGALGIGLGDRRRVAPAVLGGLIGGALGAGLYEIAGALAFPTDSTTRPVAAAWPPRLLAALSVSVLTAALATFSANAPARRARADPGP